MKENKIINISDDKKKLAEKQIIKEQKTVDYDTKEYTVELLVSKFKNDEIFIPTYQRSFVWDKKRQSKFIESVILGLPIPYIFTADTYDGRLEIVDGSQRIKTLEVFLNNGLQLVGLEKLTDLNDFKFEDLMIPQQRKFKNRSIRSIELSDKSDENVRFDIFERLNTGSDTLKDMEKRKGIYSGKFYEFINSCSMNQKFIKLCPISDTMKKRGEAEELVLRFFAYSEKYLEFEHSVKDFLNKYMDIKRDNFNSDKLKLQFERMLDFTEKNLPFGFAKSKNAKSTPRVRFEALSIGINLALEEKSSIIIKNLDWLESKEFQNLTRSDASNSKSRLRGRINFVKENLLKE